MPLTIKGTSSGGFTVKGSTTGAINVKNYLPNQETNVFLWLRADLGVTLRSGTTSVSSWTNQGTSGGSFDQATTTRQPTWNSNGRSGWPSMTWTHTSSTVTSTSLRMAQSATSINVGTNDYTFFFACNPTATVSTVIGGATNNTGLWLMDSYAGPANTSQNRLIFAHADVGGDGARLGYFTAANGNYQGRVAQTTGAQVITFELMSGNAKIYRNGSTIATGLNYNTQQDIDAVTETGAGIGLGATNGTNPAGQFHGDIYEVIGVKTTDASMRARITSYLGNRYGITVT